MVLNFKIMFEIHLKHDNSKEVHFKLPYHPEVHHLIQLGRIFCDNYLASILDHLLISHFSQTKKDNHK